MSEEKTDAAQSGGEDFSFHTYRLDYRGDIPPGLIHSGERWEGVVASSRTVSMVGGHTLDLLKEEPDLPEGEKVQVWVDRWFRCETNYVIEKKAAIQKARMKAKEDHEESVKAAVAAQYIAPTCQLLAANPEKQALLDRLDYLFEQSKDRHRVYKAYWGSYARKQDSNDALTAMSAIDESIDHLSDYLGGRLKALGLKGGSAYAYSPREGGNSGSYSPGALHYVMDRPIAEGRLSRDSGDALCKPRNKFWGLHKDPGRSVNCKACLCKMVSLLDGAPAHQPGTIGDAVAGIEIAPGRLEDLPAAVDDEALKQSQETKLDWTF